MKEFIEELKSRLKEKLLEYINKANDEMIEEGHTLDFENFLGHKEAYENVLYEIVNQLAEEWQKEHDDTDYANIELYAFWQKHQWIPCSERLPNKDLWCLVTFESGSVDKIQYLTTNKWGWNGEFADNKVIAWQPLPESYKEVGGSSEQ